MRKGEIIYCKVVVVVMMMHTQQNPVVEGGGSTCPQRSDVVTFAPTRGAVTTREATTAVAEFQQPAEFPGGRPGVVVSSGEVAGCALRPHEGDVGVAGEPAGGLGRDGGAGVEEGAVRVPRYRSTSVIVSTTWGLFPPWRGRSPMSR
jgi:hypothetical protein